MVKAILAVFDLFAWALRRAGIDYPRFRALLEVKLTLDGRRRTTMFQRQGGRAQFGGLGAALVMNTLVGLLFAMVIFPCPTPLVPIALVHSFVVVMLALSLIADFSSVLLDTTDNRILLPRPINGRTILAARLAHIIL